MPPLLLSINIHTHLERDEIKVIIQEREKREMGDVKKGRVCVTGGTGFIGSWLIKRLLQDGYSVNATTRIDPGNEITYFGANLLYRPHLD